MSKPIKVVATAPGYYVSLRAKGEEFYVAEEKDIGKWMKKVTKAEERKAAKDAKEEARGGA